MSATPAKDPVPVHAPTAVEALVQKSQASISHGGFGVNAGHVAIAYGLCAIAVAIQNGCGLLSLRLGRPLSAAAVDQA
jgi:hypothetical protein